MAEEVRETFDEKTRRKILKNKNLVLRNEEIEIGSSVAKEGWALTVVYYVTGFKDVCDFNIEIPPSSGLRVSTFPFRPERDNRLKRKKQYRLYVSIEMEEFSFFVPKTYFSYYWTEDGKEYGPK